MHVLFWILHLQTDGVKCTSTQTQTVTCQVGYPALKQNEEVGKEKERRHSFSTHVNCFELVAQISKFEAHCHVISFQMKFQINFDYNLDQLQNQAEVKFEAKRYAEITGNSTQKCDFNKLK